MIEFKTISKDEVKEILNDYYPAVETVDFHGYELSIKKVISESDLFEIVQMIADACFNEDGEYMPEAYDVTLKLGVVSLYTNLDIDQDIETWVNVIYGTNLWELVERNISYQQLDQIYESSKNRINFRLDISRAAFEREINRAIDAIGEVGDQMGELFAGVTKDDVKTLLSAISDHGIDEDKLVKSVVREQNKAREEKDNVIQFAQAEAEDGE